MVKGFIILMKKIPLLGGLFDCSITDHLLTFKEFITTIFFAFLPIIVALVVDYYTNPNTVLSISLYNIFQNGELFLYATSILAPVFYTVMNDKNQLSFPSRLIFIIIFCAIMILAAIVFALQRADVTLVGHNIYGHSIYTIAISLILLYLVTVYNNKLIRLNPAGEMLNQENDFMKSVSGHRGGYEK
jgi:glucan phosphoethanolaminetransferase (alkaline phosphatase superfamily)